MAASCLMRSENMTPREVADLSLSAREQSSRLSTLQQKIDNFDEKLMTMTESMKALPPMLASMRKDMVHPLERMIETMHSLCSELQKPRANDGNRDHVIDGIIKSNLQPVHACLLGMQQTLANDLEVKASSNNNTSTALQREDNFNVEFQQEFAVHRQTFLQELDKKLADNFREHQNKLSCALSENISSQLLREKGVVSATPFDVPVAPRVPHPLPPPKPTDDGDVEILEEPDVEIGPNYQPPELQISPVKDTGLERTLSLVVDSDDYTEVEISTGPRESRSIMAYFGEKASDMPYHVEDYYKTTGVCQAIARSSFVEHLSAIVVTLDAIYLGVESDLNEASNIYAAEPEFLLISQLFLVYFVCELFVRFMSFIDKTHALHDGWFRFDFLITAAVVLDIWIVMPIAYLVSGSHFGGAFSAATQPIRIVRVIKICRVARLVKAFPELLTMMKALKRALRSIGGALVLIGCMTYLIGLFIHALMKGEQEFNEHLLSAYGFQFERVHDCFWTLFMDGVLQLDNAALVMTSLVYGDRVNIVVAGIFFVSYSVFCALLVLQMLIALLCDIVSRVSKEQHDIEATGLVRHHLLNDLKKFDNGDGKISRDELMTVLKSDSFRSLLKLLKVNAGFFSQLADQLYAKSSAQVPIQVIMDLLVLCRGEAQTTVDVLGSAVGCLVKQLKEVEHRLANAVRTPAAITPRKHGIAQEF